MKNIIAIDGEGYTDRKGRHRYTYMAACSADHVISELHRPRGIQSHEVFDWLLALPKDATLVGFSLGYDLTKWVESMGDGAVWSLMRPDERSGEHGPRSVKWRSYKVNKVSRRFTVSRHGVRGSTRVIWDVWAFFQTSFVAALSKWEVCEPKTIARIKRMKDKRANFKRIGASERAYCRQECRLLARLVRLLLDAHADAGLVLTELYGPGSTAKLMLSEMKAHEHNVKGSPAFMRAVDVAFCAGRFENSRIGPAPDARYSYDLASAYPYAWCLLPCMKHGTWKKVGAFAMAQALDRGKLALVRWELRGDGKEHAWGPLPFRIPKVKGFEKAAGNLVWPVAGGRGWTWSPEVIAGRRLHGGIHVLGGYVFEPRCRCGFPFRKHMVGWYRARLKWGNKGKGRVLRLGMNSCTGKGMQRVGHNPYLDMVRAGLVTSFTRARLLEAMAVASNPWAIAETATDSILSREPLKLPPPVDLGTARDAKRYGSNPLGAWDASPVNPEGVFLCRPGQRFRLGDSDEEGTASRGMPVRWLHANRDRILGAWQAAPGAEMALPPPRNLRIFLGAKQGVRRKGQRWVFVRSEAYGAWHEPKPRKLSFAAAPKREHILEGYQRPEVGGYRLGGWELPRRVEAAGYSKVPESEHTRKLRELEEEKEVQE